MKVPRVLIVAGSDSGGGAGIQADIKTVAMFGGHPMAAVTAITAQNTRGVSSVLPVPPDMVLRQIDVAVEDIGVDSVKIGMIGSAEAAQAVAERLERMGGVPIVFDPVMVATSGSALADAETIAAFERLMRVATLTTPNLPELEVLSGGGRIRNGEEMEQAAAALARRTGRAVLAKGGHLETAEPVDLLVEPDGRVREWRSGRIETRHTHGTGCTLASGIAAGLGRGEELAAAIGEARDFVRAALQAAPGFGGGFGPMGHALGTVPWRLAREGGS